MSMNQSQDARRTSRLRERENWSEGPQSAGLLSSLVKLSQHGGFASAMSGSSSVWSECSLPIPSENLESS